MTHGDQIAGEIVLERVVAPGEAGRRLDVVVSVWLDEPRSRTQQRLSAGRVLVGAGAAAKSQRLQAGTAVRVLADPPPPAVTAPPVVPVRWEDADVVVVAKPAGLVVHAGAGHAGPTLVDALAAMGVPLAPGSDPDRPGVVHRLDRGTSGILVLAKTPRAHAALSEGFKAHAIDREYWALAEGHPDPAEATIDAPIVRSARDRTRFTVDPAGRPAVTHYDVTAIHPAVAELAVRLETGRTHQVRVHLSAVGHPIAGDVTYGASAVLAERLGLDRPALHARLLRFEHPITGRRVEVVEPLPAELDYARGVVG